MARPSESTGESDGALARQFIRLFGHSPTAAELARYRLARSRLALRQPGRLRRRAARLIVRL